MTDFEFTADWFTQHARVWDQILKSLKPTRILEIGSFEGRATCYMIEKCAQYGPLELHCVDTFEGSPEHTGKSLDRIEDRFDSNTNLAISFAGGPDACRLTKYKDFSFNALTTLVAGGSKGYFDLIYVDGSHDAADVLADCVLSFSLLRVGGVMILDDYLWYEGIRNTRNRDLSHPKPAIDAFVNIYQEKVSCLRAPLYQLYLRKVKG